MARSWNSQATCYNWCLELWNSLSA